ncbi:MAG: carboxypeptidase regulatory-like domain-containing protein, partial [Moraxellaceae bacterium]
AQGKKSSAVTINADGTFSVDVPKGAPYLIRAFNDNPADSLYSYAVAAGYANVTQLTTAALYDANAQTNLADLYTAWAEKVSQITEAKIIQAAKEVVGNLKETMLENGLTATEVNSLNVFNYKFAATATNKFDNFLDDVQISYACSVQACSVNYTVNDKTFSWDYNVNVNGITIDFNNTGGGIPTGDFNLKVTTTVAGVSTTVNIPKIPKPTNQQEFCGGQDILGQLPNGYTLNSCSFSGNTGTIAATINQAGFSISYSVKYEYTPA